MAASLIQKCVAELFGTFVLVFCACGTAGMTNWDVTATSLAFGLSIVAMAYSVGRVSGCHVNPAVSLAYLILGQLSIVEFIAYFICQLIGGIIGSMSVFGFLYMVLDPKLDEPNNWNIGGASNIMLMYTEKEYTIGGTFSALLTEIVLTFIFVYVFLNAAEPGAPHRNLAGFIIGGALTLVHLVGIKITGTSVNPARSLATAVSAVAYFDYNDSIEEIWIWFVGPLVGGALAPFLYKFLNTNDDSFVAIHEPQAPLPPIVANKIECSA